MFQSVRNVSFIELSDNMISKIDSDAFSNLSNLKTLRLRRNRIKLQVISDLKNISTLEELDLSENDLIGPVTSKTFPNINSLQNLQLAHNSLSSVKMGAFEKFEKLITLSLHHNQIDVLEDHAFRNLSKLMSLDLSHNRIVAISGASLAHLINLVELDIRHNFLRALTADLIIPLHSLKILKLDDNDISMVSSDALRNTTILRKLTLSENPLNCDCSLAEFAVWLLYSNLTNEDKSSAVCATPPSLENGLLIEVPIKELLCGDDDFEVTTSSFATSVKAKINLIDFHYDGSIVNLQWNVEDKAAPYTCDAMFVYEEEETNEVLLESNPLKCNSSDLINPQSLNVTVPNSENLQQGHRYRFCIVLLQSGFQTDELSLVLGCSDIMTLIKNLNLVPSKNSVALKLPKVIAIQANLTTFGNLLIDVNVYPLEQCEINLALLEQGVLLSQKKINCSNPRYTFVGLQDGPYRVCANVISATFETSQKPRCVMVLKKEIRRLSNLDIAFVTIFLVLSFMVIVLVWGVRKILLKPKLHTHQCFLPPEMEEAQHNRYVKLQATTKL